jgi:hypothetical protein
MFKNICFKGGYELSQLGSVSLTIREGCQGQNHTGGCRTRQIYIVF